MKERDFLENKKIALKKLEKAKKEKLADGGIIPILDLINQTEDYFTSSSCYGRTVLLELPIIGDKKEAKFLGKWHRTVNASEILDSVKYAKKGQIWILSQSPIIHIAAKTQFAADKMLKTAIACSFKHSGLKSLDKKIVVEVCSTERLDAPVGKDGILFCNKDHLDLLVNISNEIMKKSTLKLKKFEEKLRKDINTQKTTNE